MEKMAMGWFIFGVILPIVAVLVSTVHKMSSCFFWPVTDPTTRNVMGAILATLGIICPSNRYEKEVMSSISSCKRARA